MVPHAGPPLGGIGRRRSATEPAASTHLLSTLLALLCTGCGDGATPTDSVAGPTEDVEPCATVSLQIGNDTPCPALVTKGSRDLADNRIGGNAETEHIGEAVWNTGVTLAFEKL